MTVNDNRSLKMLIMILIFHQKGFRNENYETLSQIKKGQICYWLPFSQITFWLSSYINYPPIREKTCIKENYICTSPSKQMWNIL